ncbi:ATP-binding cassette domain-containing protein, partial [Citreimonas sp.]|uniref:ATP-binding cassette domain-containing protein n=1 Tax=Citreimonas sp. TaxID=3036715 RepID=UPI0035C79E82
MSDMPDDANRTVVAFENVSIVFGDDPQAALPLADQGQERGEIQSSTGQVLGVHDATIDVAEGEILVLMGLSGSGKSTLLRAVNGLNPVARGSVRVTCGDEVTDVTNCSAQALRRVRQGHVAMV